MTTRIDLDAMQAAAGDASRLMKALANPDRLLILCRLSQGELSVGQLEAELGILQPTLSQQLTVLREQSLVDARREGKQVFYSVRSRQALAVLKVLYRQFCSRKAGK
jgi:DNA-binding transcriptional ArsR family regulator